MTMMTLRDWRNLIIPGVWAQCGRHGVEADLFRGPEGLSLRFPDGRMMIIVHHDEVGIVTPDIVSNRIKHAFGEA